MLRASYHLHSLFLRAQSRHTEGWHECLPRMDREATMAFVNYGFVDLDADTELMMLINVSS